MQIIEFIKKMENAKNYIYNIDRQTIYNINNKELSIEEMLNDNDGNFIINKDLTIEQIKTLNIRIEINDFDNNKLLGILIKNIKDNKIISVTVCDEWLFNEIE